MSKPKPKPKPVAEGIELTFRVLTDGRSVHWTLWSTSGKVLANGTENNRRLADKSAAHQLRVILAERKGHGSDTGK